MGRHNTHTMRTQIEAYDKNNTRLSARSKMILECLKGHGDGTSYDILCWLKEERLLPEYAESNAVRPRLTELYNMGLVTISGKKRSFRSGVEINVYSVSMQRRLF